MTRSFVTVTAITLASCLTATSLAVGNCPCATDLNLDGATNAADLAVLLGTWNGEGIADLDENGVIDAADLGILLGAWGPCAAPNNDNCGLGPPVLNGVEVFEPFCTAAATDNAVPLPLSNCGQAVSMGKDIWYRYQPTDPGKLIIDTCDSGFDTVLALYVNTQIPERCLCPIVDYVQVVACNDDSNACGLQSRLEIDVEEDFQTASVPCYTIRLGGFQGVSGTAAGSGTLHVRAIKQGDRCDVAHELPSDETVSVFATTVGDTWVEADQSSCASDDTIDEWYRYEMPCDGTIEITTCDPYTDFDTTLAVYTDCGLTQIACDDDSPDEGCQIGRLNRKSKVSFAGNSGEVFYIRVSGYQGAAGNFRLLIDVDCVG